MIRPWRIHVMQGRPAPGGLALDLDVSYVLPDKYFTRSGAWRAAQRWKDDYERRRLGIGQPRFIIVVSVVHRRELAS